jgi:hypothetical protein
VLGTFVIAGDARGSVVHVRRRDDGECVGCLEVGLYEIVRSLILAEVRRVRGEAAAMTDVRALEGGPRHRRVVIVLPSGGLCVANLIRR